VEVPLFRLVYSMKPLVVLRLDHAYAGSCSVHLVRQLRMAEHAPAGHLTMEWFLDSNFSDEEFARVCGLMRSPQ